MGTLLSSIKSFFIGGPAGFAGIAPIMPWIALTAGLLAIVVYLLIGAKRVNLHRRVILLAGLAFCVLLLAYIDIVWAGIISDRYLRVERPWAALVMTVGAAFVAWRLAGWTRRQTLLRRRFVDALAMVATICAGLVSTGIELGRPMDRMTVLVAVDRSRSIDLVPGADERVQLDLRIAENGMQPKDKIGTIAFASEAVSEQPPRVKSELPMPQQAHIGRDGTDIGAAIRRALAEVPADSAARIVLMSDGVSNRGDPMSAAAAAVAADVPVDNVVLDQRELKDIRVVAVRMPGRANQGETLDMHVVTASSEPAQIEIRIKRDGQLVAKSLAKIAAGEDVLRIRQPAPDPGFHRYDVEISASDPSLDQAAEDNTGSAFVRVRGPAVALVLEGDPGKGSFISQSLQMANFVVREGSVAQIPAGLSELAMYDVVFLSDIPAHSLVPMQIEAFASYVRDLGGGLVLMGGDRSMGPGGYSQTPLEEVSPVSFDIKQDRRRASLAEVIIIDYSGSMQAMAGSNTKLELANEASVRSAELLGPGDRLGVMHVDTSVSWTVPLGPVTDKQAITKAIRAVKTGGGGILVDISLTAAYQELRRERVNLKHTVLFADGDDAEQLTGCRQLVKQAQMDGITTSVVALGKGSDVAELETLSRIGDGRFYLIEDARKLPVVFTQETILASRSSIREEDFRVSLGISGSATAGIDFQQAPILKGYVVTLPKARASVLLTGPESDPIVASWSVGMGRSAAFMSDLKDRWGTHWTRWPGASTLVAQLARDVTRVADDPKIRLQADTSGGQLHVRAELVDDQGRQQSFKRLVARIVGPDGTGYDMELEPVGSGAYAATKPLSRPGTYVVSARDAQDSKVSATTAAVLTAGEEMRPTGSDRALLNRIAAMTDGKTRDTLAGVFADRASLRFAYDSLTPWLSALAAAFLLASVGARRLSLPSRTAKKQRKPARAAANRPSPPHETSLNPVPAGAPLQQQQQHPSSAHAAPPGTAATSAPEPVGTFARLEGVIHRSRQAQVRTMAPPAPLPPSANAPIPWQTPPATPPTPSATSTTARSTTSGTHSAQQRQSAIPKGMTSAEIILQRRKGKTRQ